jgi:Zn-dependent M16 (insulinase) family peptidase
MFILFRYSFLGYLGEVTGGLTSVRDASKILDLAEKNWPEVEQKLKSIQNKILKKDSTIINLTADDKTMSVAVKEIENIINKLPLKTSFHPKLIDSWKATKTENTLSFRRNEGFIVPSQINYVCKGTPIYYPGDSISASTSVVSRYLSTGYLWDNVRVVGGAYGGFVRFSERSGRIVFLSYRDPNLYNTLQIYDKAGSYLAEAEISSEDILQAIVGTVGDLDSPLSPDQKGFASMTQYIIGETPVDRQKAMFL